MFEQLNRHTQLSLLVFAIALFLYLFNAQATSIYILDEAKNAECAREMFESGDWIVPTFNGELRTDKPPLHYYFMMLAYSLFGVTPFAARFFSALFGALTVTIVFQFARQFGDERKGLLTALTLLSSILLHIQFQLATPDPYLVFFTTSAIISFYRFLSLGKKKDWFLLYCALGLGALAKGPIAIVLPGMIFFVFLILRKQLNFSTINRFKPFAGAALLLLIAAPWYVLVHLKTQGAWTEGFFLQHNIGRFTNKFEGHGGTFLITILFALLGLYPLSVFLPQAIAHAFRQKQNPFLLYNLTAGLLIVGFFMLSKTRLPSYTVPALPFLAVLVGHWLSAEERKPATLKWGIWIIGGISLLLAPAIRLALHMDQTLTELQPLGWYFIPVPVIMIWAVWKLKKQQTKSAIFAAGVSGVAASLLLFALVYPPVDRMNPVTASLPLIEGKEVRWFEKFNPAFVFALQKELPQIERDSVETFFHEFPDGVIISTRKKVNAIELPTNAAVSFAVHDLFESPETVLITRKSYTDSD